MGLALTARTTCPSHSWRQYCSFCLVSKALPTTVLCQCLLPAPPPPPTLTALQLGWCQPHHALGCRLLPPPVGLLGGDAACCPQACPRVSQALGLSPKAAAEVGPSRGCALSLGGVQCLCVCVGGWRHC